MHRFVPMADAVRILGRSATTIRRKIASGELEAERITRPQGEAWLIRVTGDPPPATAGPPGATQEPPGTLQESPGASQHAPPSTDVLTVVVAPLLAEVAASRQIIERQAQQLVSQAETIGRQAAELERAASIAVKLSDELEAARAQISPLVVSTATEPPDPTTKPFWSRWRTSAPWLLLAVILLLAVVLLGWLR